MSNTYNNLIFSKHALERMERRAISKEMVRRALADPDKTFLGHSNESVKFIKKINNRNTHVIATLLPEKKWLIVSVWIRGEDDSAPLAWQIISFPFRIIFKILWWSIKTLTLSVWKSLRKKK